MNRIIKFIPNLLTLSNLFLGCLGIIFCFSDQIFPVNAAEIDPTGKNVAVVFGFNNRLYLASFMIYAAAIVDFLDGFAARWLNATSALGGELDSLADVVTFGVLPGCIYYQLLSASWHLEPEALYLPMLYTLPAFLVSVCAAFRLGKFNVDERQHEAFLGLATPAMAIFAASLPLIIFTNALGLSMLLLNKWLLYSFVVVFAWLMVAEIPMFALKSKSYGWRGNEWQIVFLILCVLLVVLFKYAGIAACILLYVITNILRNNLRKPQTPNPEL